MTHIGLELEVGSMFRVITHGTNVISRLRTEACRDGYSRDGYVTRPARCRTLGVVNEW